MQVRPLETNNIAALAATEKEYVATALQALTCNGTSMLLVSHNRNYVGEGLRLTAWTLTGLLLLCGALLVGWTIAKRKSPIIRASQPSFLILIVVGSLVSCPPPLQ